MAVQQTQMLPPQYVEDLQKDLGTQLTALTAAPLDTAKFAPQVAGQDQAQLMLTQWLQHKVKVLVRSHLILHKQEHIQDQLVIKVLCLLINKM
jgi:hypothetical protein